MEGSLERREAARMGREAFFDPEILMDPCRDPFPWTRSLSI
jgi:hypothetical protein